MKPSTKNEGATAVQRTPIPGKAWFLIIMLSLIGQIAWAVETNFFNLFIQDVFGASLSDVALMVSASAITATAINNDLGSPVMTYALYTDTDINDPYKYDKRYAVTVMIPDSALEYVIRNLNSNRLQCDGEFVRELLKQTGTDLPVLSVSEILTDPYLFYDEDEMFAALNRPFMGYKAATGSAD